ncbi:unnamed protein product [Allacma fusca]|uniref:Uncharacterized protein n=1 Tax=Allacma fusca TaxID=39272 RepID=A0A8J2LGD6_9HEXA|nr:unnamed protein product [Allacma fusca]
MEKNPTVKYACLEQTTNAILEKYGPPTDCSIVGQFLIANHSTLVDLSLGGEGFKLEGLNRTQVGQIKQLKLSHLLCSFDTEGLEDILDDQRKLKHLTFKDVDKQKLSWELLPRMLKYAATNSKKLKEFSIYFYSETETDSIPIDLVYSGEDFRKCHHLQSLILGIVACSEKEKLAPEFVRIHSLPRSLVEISITCHDFKRSDFDLLGNCIHEFKNLERMQSSSTWSMTTTNCSS